MDVFEDLINFFDASGFKNIDWTAFSQGIAEGIGSIDWSQLGAEVREGLYKVRDALEKFFREVDWGDLFKSASQAFMDFMAGLYGQGDWDNVMATWKSNFDQLGQIVTNSLNLIKSRGVAQAAAIGAAIPYTLQLQLAAGANAIANVVYEWIPPIHAALLHVS